MILCQVPGVLGGGLHGGFLRVFRPFRTGLFTSAYLSSENWLLDGSRNEEAGKDCAEAQ
jgi:hypothetical protein